MVGKCSLYELALFSYWPELKQSKEFFENYSISKVYKNNLFVVAIIAYENGYLTKYTIDENKKLWPSYNSFNPCVSQNQHFSKSTDLMTIIGEVELKSKSIKIIERDRDLILKISKDDHKKI
ncbi:hypothetical protein FACS189496_3140 [Bacilli bacterium]|nr:hypothetical protein FACS189496_3140 [Bacilli bacterium]